jgi:transcriptional regulator with XRE-family HTH domain
MMERVFGDLLKHWRGQRRLSQLALGLQADVSARHVAFLETGRSRPSRSMVLQLAETLAVPRSERNTMLNAAGFAAAYAARQLDDASMLEVRKAIDWMIARHAPYPAFVLDRHWVMVKANAPAGQMLGTLGVRIGASLLDVLCQPGFGAAVFVNWPEVGHHMIQRLRTESAHHGGDAILERAAAQLASDVQVAGFVQQAPLTAVIPAQYRAGDQVLSLFSTLAQFGSAEDIALADLRIELLFPADGPSEQLLLAMTGASSTAS